MRYLTYDTQAEAEARSNLAGQHMAVAEQRNVAPVLPWPVEQVEIGTAGNRSTKSWRVEVITPSLLLEGEQVFDTDVEQP